MSAAGWVAVGGQAGGTLVARVQPYSVPPSDWTGVTGSTSVRGLVGLTWSETMYASPSLETTRVT